MQPATFVSLPIHELQLERFSQMPKKNHRNALIRTKLPLSKEQLHPQKQLLDPWLPICTSPRLRHNPSHWTNYNWTLQLSNAFDKTQIHFPPDTTHTPKPDPTRTSRFCLMQPLTKQIRGYATVVKLWKFTKIILQKFTKASDGKSLDPFDYIFPLGSTGSYK